ncbi:MAG: 23S rRNA (adenine(2503)-C(2))-methyltransferase RlmN [Abditibacteriota bacterium]|nr:23S rRNA (adenine(2503)-C(2))-methyltransferase RlmN [Abditibacteriota bacterium]
MLKYHSLSEEETAALLAELQAPSFRAGQLRDWVYGHKAASFDEMTNLPKGLRESLKDSLDLETPECADRTEADDGTCKYLLRLGDGALIECVYLPYSDRRSVCVSTQVGCAVGCAFCASCLNGFVRNLTCGEIVNQILFVERETGERISHVVFMGIGEPLHNIEQVTRACGVINKRLGISQRRITVSTSGIVSGIRRLADLQPEFTLALSLHSPFQEQRQQLIPIARRNTLEDIESACAYYFERTGRRITLEYLLLDGVNTSGEAAEALAGIARRLKAHVNLIPYNPVEGKPFRRPSGRTVSSFAAILGERGVPVTQRLERGSKKGAACGQLRNMSKP